MKDKINYHEKRLEDLNCKIDKVVDSLVWWIPFKRLRSKFRGKF